MSPPRLQAQAVMGCLALDAPCRVSGRITANGTPFAGPARVATRSGREVAAFQTDPDGRFGPVHVAGGGALILQAGTVSRAFPAVAGAETHVDLDTEREIVLATEALSIEGVPVPVKRGFPHLKAGAATTVRLLAKPAGAHASEHTVTLHAVNAAVEPQRVTVAVTGGEPSPVVFIVTARNAGETVCVLAEIDGDHTRKWELSAVAE